MGASPIYRYRQLPEGEPTNHHDVEAARLAELWKLGAVAISTAAGSAAIGGTLGIFGALGGAVIGALLIALLYFHGRAHRAQAKR